MNNKVSEENHYWQLYAIFALLAPIPFIVVSAYSKDSLSLFMNSVIFYCTIPIIVYGFYMWIEGSGHRWINGVDWTKLTPSQLPYVSRFMGKIMVIGTVVFAIALSFLLYEVPIGIITVVLGCVVYMAILFYGIAHATNKEFLDKAEFYKPCSRKTGIAIMIASIIIIGSASTVILSESTSSESVNITLEDEYFTVKAPAFNQSFDYDKIEKMYLDEDFDKGKRIGGYGTPTIHSGTFKNSEFGNYSLASYTNIKPCIVIFYNEDYYAFNQSSDAATKELFDLLSSKIKL